MQASGICLPRFKLHNFYSTFTFHLNSYKAYLSPYTFHLHTGLITAITLLFYFEFKILYGGNELTHCVVPDSIESHSLDYKEPFCI